MSDRRRERRRRARPRRCHHGVDHVVVEWVVACTMCDRSWDRPLPLCRAPQLEDLCCPFHPNAPLLWVAPNPLLWRESA